jgi:hypothetical protein
MAGSTPNGDGGGELQTLLAKQAITEALVR